MVIIDTERLQLEKIDQTHFENLVKLFANERVHHLWPDPKTRTREETREYFNKIQTQYRELGYSYYAIVRKDDFQFIGICGLLPEEVNMKEEVEVAYRVDDAFWGKGYGTEAANVTMKYAHEKLGWSSIISLILPENEQSIRVAQKNGLVPDGEKVHVGKVHTIWRKKF